MGGVCQGCYRGTDGGGGNGHVVWKGYCQYGVEVHFHPKTLIEMWITCLDRVSANSEKGRGSEWAVRVGQRLQSRFGQSGSVRELNLVQIVVEVSAIRGGLPSTWQFEPVFASGWRGCSVLRDYRHGLFFGTACYKLILLR